MGVDALTVRLQAIFTEELDEQLQQLNDDILGLERAPEDGERLRAVFRVMHTLKGASRAAGLPLVEQLCHAIEERLSRVRDGGAVLAQAEIALLFEAADALGEKRDNLRLGMPAADATLSAVLQRAGENRTPVSDVAAVAAPVVAAVGVDPHHNERRTGQVRVSLQHVDAITSAAGEIAGLAAILEFVG